MVISRKQKVIPESQIKLNGTKMKQNMRYVSTAGDNAVQSGRKVTER